MQSIQHRTEPFILRLLAEVFEDQPEETANISPIDDRTVTVLMAVFAIAAVLFGTASGVIAH